MVPRFNRETHGYNMRQVDDYIDAMHKENQELSRVNDQLMLLYVAEIRQLTHMKVELPEKSDDEDELSLEKINRLIKQAYSHKERRVHMEQQLEDMAGPRRKPSRPRWIVPGVFLCVFLVLFVLVTYMFGMGAEAGPPRSILGFSAMTVLTRSMQEDIPQDSLIITRRVAPETIQIGDDITYLTLENTAITHRVVDIRQNYADTGLPGFETQGTRNPEPDPEIVPAANVVGLVIFHSLFLGNVVLFLRSYALLIGIFVVLTVVLVAAARWLILREEKDT